MDTAEVIQRFERERQTLAVMEHPNIAKVHEAGATQLGRPFFVMEFVDGQPITDYCKEKGLSLEGRLQLILDVCQGIEHAHRKGIIHRDLKPSNILVNAEGVPKIIDFGIAKAAADEGGTLFTRETQMLGTPAYMSPEQASGNAAAIDTRSDVYSLGVVLYELLAGAPPFDPDRLSRTGLAEIQKILSEEEPTETSTRVAATTVAKSVDFRPLHFEKDLDWLVMKAMAKEPERRYASAALLGEEVQRYLDGEAVTAVPPTAFYRASKFVRRNKLVVAAASAVALSLVAGMIVSLVHVKQANDARAETTLTVADLYANNGFVAAKDGETSLAALWFAQAAVTASSDSERVQANLMRTRTWTQQKPAVVRAIQTDIESFEFIHWHAGGRHLLVHGSQGHSRLLSLDTETVITFPQLDEGLRYARWSHDGRFLAAVSGGRVLLLAWPSGEIVATLDLEGTPRHLEWNPTDDTIAIGGNRGVLWRPFASESIQVPNDDGQLSAMHFSADGKKLLLHSAQICVRETSDPATDLFPPVPCDYERGVGFLGPEGEAFYLAIGTTIQVRHATSGALLESHTTTVDHRYWGQPINSSKDGQFLVTTGHQLIDRAQQSDLVQRYDSLFSAFAWGPDEATYAIGNIDHRLRVYERATKEVRHELGPFRLPCYALAYSPRHHVLASAHNESGVVRIWQLEPSGPESSAMRLPIQSHLYAVSPDARWLLPVGSGAYFSNPIRTTRIFALTDGQPAGPELQTEGEITHGCFNRDSTWCALGIGTGPVPRNERPDHTEGHVELWDPVKGVRLAPPIPCPAEPRGLAAHPDGHTIGILCADGSALEIARHSDGTIDTHPLFQTGWRALTGGDSVNNGQCRYSDDGRHFIVYSRQGFLVWDRQTSQPVAIDTKATSSLDADTQGSLLALALSNNKEGIGVFDLATSQWAAPKIPFSQGPHLMRFDHSGSRLLTNSGRSSVQVFDWKRGQALGPTFDHAGSILAGDFVKGTDLVATGGTVAPDVHFWDVATGFERRPQLGFPSSVYGIEHVPDGRRLIISAGGLYLYDVDQLFPSGSLSPEGALQLAELNAGSRVRSGGGMDILNNDAWFTQWRAFRAQYPEHPAHQLPPPLALPPMTPETLQARGEKWLQAKASTQQAEARRRATEQALAAAIIITPITVQTNTATDARPDHYPAENLIDGSGLSRALRHGADILTTGHGFARPETAWVTESNGADYFHPEPFSLPPPVLTVTLEEAVEISGMVYWGYIFNDGGSAIGHEPSKMRFRFFDSNDQPIGAPVDHELSAPTRERARVLPLPSTPGVKRIEIEMSDNFEHLSGGDRVGMGEIRFLSGYRAPVTN